MELAHQVLRVVHIASGFTAFFMAPFAMIVRKGGRWHRRWGTIYFWAMMVATVLATMLAAAHENWFLFVVGIFSFYLTFQGRRVLLRKRPDRGQRAKPADWAVAMLALLTGVSIFIWGILNGYVLAIAFGALISLVLGGDLKKLRRPTADRAQWFFDHIAGMVASYIAALTAFSVTNFSFLPILLRWFWPTIVIVPILSFVIARYKKKFARGQQPKDVAHLQLALLPE